MAEYSDAEFEKKLNELRDSQKEIQSLSAWLVHHRKHCKAVIRVWYKNLKAVHISRKLTCMYLANDVVQNSRRKGPDYVREFSQVVVKTFQYLAGVDFDDKTVMSLIRLTGIWQERQIFEKKILQEISKIWERRKSAGKMSNENSNNTSGSEPRRRSNEIMDIDEMLESPLRNLEKKSPKRTHPIALEETITLSPRMGSPGSGDPPEPEELIVALQDLENSASSDAEVREKIAKLPPEVSEVAKMEELQTYEEGTRLLLQVEAASGLLTDYNARLQEELKERRKVGTMVAEFLSAQKELLAQSEERLEIYQEKLEKIRSLKDELKSHIAALPDIPQLPSSEGSSLAPLPSAGDLFTL